MLSLRKPLACQQMVELITDYLEDALTRGERRRFETHLAGCEHCSEYLAEMRTTIALTGGLSEQDLTPVMRREFTAVFGVWLREREAGEAPL